MPLVSIMIPTNRPRAVQLYLRAVAEQHFDLNEVEVVVVYNGLAAAPSQVPDAWPFELIVERIAPASVVAARNVALDRARGEWLIFANDDVVPAPDFIAAHLAAHERLSQPAMVLGEAVWRRYDDETVFDRMIQATSMIFFYDQMKPHRWYDFRHAWTLNLSVARRYCATLRFDESLKPVNFDDLEWAFRMERACGLRVWYAPEIRAIHDHRYSLEGYLARERHLGGMAARLWRCNPDCYRAIYGDDLDEAYLDYCRQFVRREGRREEQTLRRLRDVVARRPDELSSARQVQSEIIQALYCAHLPLKRLAFRRGLLQAAGQYQTSCHSSSDRCGLS